MRTTWLILVLMLVAGAGMYYFATRKKPLALYDTITIDNTPDSIRKKIRLFVAYTPAEITYADSAWMVQDSIPLKEISLDSVSNTFDKGYKSATFYLDYDHAWFYDVEVTKADQNIPYAIKFAVKPAGNALEMNSTIDNPQGSELRINGPMIKMYKAFVLTYNDRVKQERDSSIVDTSGRQPSKTISVLRN